jgi:hypothetical protein
MAEDNKTENQDAGGKQYIDFSKWGGPIETASKVAVGMIALAYVVGLLILNQHVRKYGIYYLGFLQIEYVMVGMLWAFLVGLMCCLLIVIFDRARQIFEARKAANKHKAIVKAAGYFLMACFIGYTALGFVLSVLTEDNPVRYTGHWTIISALVFGALSIFNIRTKVSELGTHLLSEHAQSNKNSKFYRIFDLFYFTVIFVSVLSIYANNAFPKISPTYGGGKPQQANFLIKNDQVETVKAMGLQLPQDNRTVGPLEVVFEASDFFLIIPPQGFTNAKIKAIRLNKDLIDAAFYLK